MMQLPTRARQHLSRSLHAARSSSPQLRKIHTLPIREQVWNRYSTALAAALTDLATLGVRQIPPNFEGWRDWVEQVLSARETVMSLVLALEPFAPFDRERGLAVLGLADLSIEAAIDAVENGLAPPFPTDALSSEARWWRESRSGLDAASALRIAFDVREDPCDTDGRFRAERVLEQYAYRNQRLVLMVLSHLESLGIPGLVDLLVGISVVGWIVESEDPVSAYCAFDAFVSNYLDAPVDVARAAVAHLEAAEPALRRARQSANRQLSVAANVVDDREASALALASAHVTLVEGPVRQFAWAVHAFKTAKWATPPMLTSLRERLVAEGGFLGQLAQTVVISELRNSSAHQTLHWDGFTEEFVAGADRVAPARVANATVQADAFANGSAAGLAAVRAFLIAPAEDLLPTSDESGRMPSWNRIHAFFGTNRLLVTEARLNARNAQITLERLSAPDLNPCFQALLQARLVAPEIETFSVGRVTGDPLVVVSAAALDATLPGWKFALSMLDRMPLVTFLPSNLDARRRVEDLSTAVRSVGWIATDDVLDLIDGTPDWDEGGLDLIDTRLRLAEIAVEQTIHQLDGYTTRLASVRDSARELRRWLNQVASPDPISVEQQPALIRLRTQWAQWGPVLRHPLIEELTPPDASEPRPARYEAHPSDRFRTI